MATYDQQYGQYVTDPYTGEQQFKLREQGRGIVSENIDLGDGQYTKGTYDFSGAKQIGSWVETDIYTGEEKPLQRYLFPDGSVVNYNIGTKQIDSYTPSLSTYENQQVKRGYANTPYASSSYQVEGLPQGYGMFQGQIVPTRLEEYVINPQTGKPITTQQLGIDPNTGEQFTYEKPTSIWEVTPFKESGLYKAGKIGTIALLGAMLGGGGYEALTSGASGAGGGFVGMTPEFATQLGLSGGSGLGTAGATGNVLAGIYGAESIPSFVGMTPEFSSELGLSGGSGLGTAGASGNVLSNVYGAGNSLFSTAKDIYQGVKLAGALRDAVQGGGGAYGSGMSMGYGGRGGYNYQNLPFLQAPQQEGIFAQTGQNVSGFGQTQDTRRNTNLMANLLRG